MFTLGDAAQSAAKKLLALSMVAGLAFTVAGCSGGLSPATSAPGVAEEQVVELSPVDLTGEWKQANSDDPERWSEATVTADAITVNWVADSGDTRALFWAGSVEAPTDNAQTFSWDSVNDTEQTANSLLASDSPTKTFTYADGVLSYEASMMGVTTTIKLERQ